MKIVAFLQNMWVRDPEWVRQMLERQRDPVMKEQLRRRVIAYALFAGCLTGRRLQSAFGKELCEQIVWEESSREIGGHASSNFPPDPIHIGNVLKEEKPDMVLSFSKAAHNVIQSFQDDERGKPRWWFVSLPHPACRHADIMEKLRLGRDCIVDLMNKPTIETNLEEQAFAAAHSLLTVRQLKNG